MTSRLSRLLKTALQRAVYGPLASVLVFAGVSLGANFAMVSPASAASGLTNFGVTNNIDPAAQPDAKCTNDRCDFIKKYINPFINLLSAAFGIIAVASLIMGGIQYSASEGDPQKVSQSKKRIVNTIIAIVAFFFLYGFLQFLVPGGIFNRAQP